MACCILFLHPLPTQTQSEWCTENSSWNKSWFTLRIGLKCAQSNSSYTGLSKDGCQATSFLSLLLRAQNTDIFHSPRATFQVEHSCVSTLENCSLLLCWSFLPFAFSGGFVCLFHMNVGFPGLVSYFIHFLMLLFVIMAWRSEKFPHSIFRLLHYILFIQMIVLFFL